MSLSPEVKLQTILQEKEKVRKATDEISDIIKKLGKGSPYRPPSDDDPYFRLDEQSALAVRQKIHQIISSLSVIAGFCDKSAQDHILRIESVARNITAKHEITCLEGFLLEKFCTVVNGIGIDFNKTPFSFYGEVQARFDKFVASVKASYKKR